MVTVSFTSYENSVAKALDRLGAGAILAGQSRILIKPNLVLASPHPVTTSPEFCMAVAGYIRLHSDAEIIIAEGTGDPESSTHDVFNQLGYKTLFQKHNIPLIDLNTAPLRKISRNDCPRFPDMYLPKIAFTHFIISLPVLKAHSLSFITGSLKNMMGFAPPAHYSGTQGIWNKADFHTNIHQAIIDLNKYRRADLTLLDASIGLADYHLGGRTCDPPVNKLIAGFEPQKVDRKAAELLGHDWRTIPHLA
jgi:uncharacterized protein (DUF362 family)